MTLGTKSAVVNANVYKIFFGSPVSSNEYILATRKEAVYKKNTEKSPYRSRTCIFYNVIR